MADSVENNTGNVWSKLERTSGLPEIAILAGLTGRVGNGKDDLTSDRFLQVVRGGFGSMLDGVSEEDGAVTNAEDMGVDMLSRVKESLGDRAVQFVVDMSAPAVQAGLVDSVAVNELAADIVVDHIDGDLVDRMRVLSACVLGALELQSTEA